jgi:serine/threonine protein kinase
MFLKNYLSCRLFSHFILSNRQKPDNVGFDKNGKTKLFDFGLAKELNDDERTKNGLYRMTGFTGSIRYMSPEVGMGMPYNEKADVYSFGILLWYFMALEPPFGLYTNRLIQDRVQTGNRPVLMDAWPEGIKMLINRCWSGKIKSRPSFATIMKLLKDEVAAKDPHKALEMFHYPAKQPVETGIEQPFEARMKKLERNLGSECSQNDTQDC